MNEKSGDMRENCQKQLERAILVLSSKTKTHRHAPGNIEAGLSWNEKFLNKRVKRGHFWIWRNNMEIMNNKNFVEVDENCIVPERKVGLKIKSKNVKLRRHRKISRPIEFHDETLEEWLLNRMYNGKLNGGIKFIRQDRSADYDARMEAWNERFVKKGVKRGHLWLWWSNRKDMNGNNFVEVDENCIVPESEVKVKISSPKRSIKFHKENLDEWLIEKIIFHGKNVMEEISREKQVKTPKIKRPKSKSAGKRSK